MNFKLSNIEPDHDFGIKGLNPLLNDLTNYSIPKQEGNKIVTANKMGFMKSELDIFSRDFISFAISQKHPVLEIGACYGLVSLEALKRGCSVIANDIAEEHLSVIYQKTPKKYLNNLYLNLNYFPSITNFPENTLGAVLACRIFHFLSGKEVEQGLDKIYKWLVPGGKFYFVTLSPYHFLLKEKFLPIYNQRLALKEFWPGIIENMHEYNPKEKTHIPQFLHVFDKPQLEMLLQKHGFTIEILIKYDYDNDKDDFGYIGFVAKK